MMSLKKSLKNNKGFTLVELIVVLVILAILAAFTIPAMLGFVEDARSKAAIAEAQEVYVAAQAAVAEYSANLQGPLDTYLMDNIPKYLEGDIKFTKDKEGHYIEIAVQYDTKPVIDPLKKQYIVGIELGAENTPEKTTIKSIQYVDKSKRYKITITPGISTVAEKFK